MSEPICCFQKDRWFRSISGPTGSVRPMAAGLLMYVAVVGVHLAADRVVGVVRLGYAVCCIAGAGDHAASAGQLRQEGVPAAVLRQQAVELAHALAGAQVGGEPGLRVLRRRGALELCASRVKSLLQEHVVGGALHGGCRGSLRHIVAGKGVRETRRGENTWSHGAGDQGLAAKRFESTRR